MTHCALVVPRSVSRSGLAKFYTTPTDGKPANWSAICRYSRPMAEAKPDPSGSTGEFRAFVERGGVEQARRGLRSPAIVITAVLAVLIVVVVVVLAVR